MFLSLRVCARSALFGSLTLMPGCGQEATAPVSPAAAVSPPAPPPTTSSPDAPEPTPVPDEVAAWLDANVHPFDGPHLSLPSDDLQFLPELVGDARIVSLGEGTHGTRDFFEMKGADPPVPGRGDGFQHLRHRSHLAGGPAARSLCAHR